MLKVHLISTVAIKDQEWCQIMYNLVENKKLRPSFKLLILVRMLINHRIFMSKYLREDKQEILIKIIIM
jgi:hypothetical protein